MSVKRVRAVPGKPAPRPRTRKPRPSQATGAKRGQPVFQPTPDHRKLVQVMVGLLCPVSTIAANIANGISVNTLKKYFTAELTNGHEQTVAALKVKMFQMADRGSVKALQYLLDRLGGPEYAPRMRLGGLEDAPPIALSTESKVTFYLPDNGRGKPPEGTI